MPIDFHAEKNRYTYATREADSSWIRIINSLVDVQGKRVLDIGCGGGIYSRAWAKLGAAEVVGLDFSDQMVQVASELSQDIDGISFRIGDALSTGLSDQSADIVFERALIHHISDLPPCLNEAHRLLLNGGIYIIQDRTPQDVRLPGSSEHIRGYFFEKYPHLLEVEDARRRNVEEVQNQLERAGFNNVKIISFWETRRIHPDFTTLAADLKVRTGRSMLHELSDDEIIDLIDYISGKVPYDKEIIEKDRWTIWYAERTR